MPRAAKPKGYMARPKNVESNVTTVRPTTFDPDDLADKRLKDADRPWWIRLEKTPDAKAPGDIEF